MKLWVWLLLPLLLTACSGDPFVYGDPDAEADSSPASDSRPAPDSAPVGDPHNEASAPDAAPPSPEASPQEEAAAEASPDAGPDVLPTEASTPDAGSCPRPSWMCDGQPITPGGYCVQFPTYAQQDAYQYCNGCPACDCILSHGHNVCDGQGTYVSCSESNGQVTVICR